MVFVFRSDLENVDNLVPTIATDYNLNLAGDEHYYPYRLRSDFTPQDNKGNWVGWRMEMIRDCPKGNIFSTNVKLQHKC